MIYLLLAILSILISFLILKYKDQGNISNLSECSICHHTFPENHIFIADELPFCENDFYIYRNSQWVVIDSAVSSDDYSLDGVRLYEYKIKLYKETNIPTVLRPSYNIINNKICTSLFLLARQGDLSKIKIKDPSGDGSD